MTYGLKVVNDSGFIQIDETDVNLYTIASGTLPPRASPLTPSPKINISTSNANQALVFARPVTTLPYTYQLSYLEVLHSNEVEMALWAAQYSPAVDWTPVPVEYCVVLPMYSLGGPSPTGFGLNVMRPDGVLSFTSEVSLKFPKVVDVLSGLPAPGTATLFYPTLADKWVLMGGIAGSDVDGAGVAFYGPCLWNFSNNSLTFEWKSYGEIGGGYAGAIDGAFIVSRFS